MFVAGEDTAAAQQVEVVADAFQRGDFPGGEDDRPPLGPQPQEELLHDEHPLGFQPAEGFVEQQDAFVAHQRQNDAEMFPRQWIQRCGLCVGRYGEAAEQRLGIGRAVVVPHQPDAVAGGESGPEVRVGLQKGHLAALQRMSRFGDRPGVGRPDAVEGFQQGAPPLPRYAVHGISRQVHRYAVEQHPPSVADPE